jgi:hypothetical protein
MPDPIACPDPTCTAPAMIIDRWTWRSTNGPVEHVKTRCARGHWFTPTLDALAAQPASPPLVAPTLRQANALQRRGRNDPVAAGR